MTLLELLSIGSKIPFWILELKRILQLKATELRNLQNKRLRALIKHSYDHVPYYNSLFKKANLTPDDIKTVDDLTKIPVTKKADIRNLPIESLTANNIDLSKCRVGRTSGTSGIPLTVYTDNKIFRKDGLSHIFFQLNHGEKISNKRVSIAGSFPASPLDSLQKLGIFRTKKISPFDHPQKQLEEIKNYDARTIISNPSNVRVLAKEIRESNFKGIETSLIFTSGEFIHEKARSFIEGIFEASLFDSYGANEVGRVAGECSEHHYHIDDRVFIQATRDGETLSSGEEGEIVATNLIKHAMPFIRYNLDDFGMTLEEECSCGFHFPLMKLTSGRVSDVIHVPNGRIVSANEVNGFLMFIQEIKQYQVIQETTKLITVKIVKGRGFEDNRVSEIKETFKKNLGKEIETNVMIVDDIPREKSGKFKLFKTNIPMI